MNEYDPTEATEEAKSTAPIQVDVYGVRVRIAPPKTLDEGPLTWQAVWQDAKQSFMRICRDLTGFAADTCTSARNTVRGLGILPVAAARRIAGAHNRAEKGESIASAAATGTSSASDANIAVHRVRDLLAALNAEGIATNMSISPNGTILISAVRPDLKDSAIAAIEESASEVRSMLVSKDGVELLKVFDRARGFELRKSLVRVDDLDIDPESKQQLADAGLLRIIDLVNADARQLDSVLNFQQLEELGQALDAEQTNPREMVELTFSANVPISDFNTDFSPETRDVFARYKIKTLGDLQDLLNRGEPFAITENVQREIADLLDVVDNR